MSEEVVVVAVFRTKTGTEHEVVEALSRAAAKTHEEPGCLRYALHRSS